jgi:hypothetical protein
MMRKFITENRHFYLNKMTALILLVVQKMNDVKTNGQILTDGRSKNERFIAKVGQILGCISR